MKKSLLYLATAALLISTFSCGDTKTVESDKHDHRTKTLNYNSDSTKITWVAYKTTDKKGVNGQFTDFKVSGTKEGSTANEVFSDATFIIQTNSVVTGNMVRDNRIIKNFFNIFVNSETITGKVISLSDNSGILEISLNGLTNKVPVSINTDGNNFSLNGKIDLNNFNGEAATDSLNYVCKEVHKGPDGITKLWPDVAIKVSTVLTAK